jgi:hypothetical protein
LPFLVEVLLDRRQFHFAVPGERRGGLRPARRSHGQESFNSRFRDELLNRGAFRQRAARTQPGDGLAPGLQPPPAAQRVGLRPPREVCVAVCRS